MLETLRGEGAPPPACRAVVHAALRYVDAELLNALMLRRDACSISAVKALQVRERLTPPFHAMSGSAEAPQSHHMRTLMTQPGLPWLNTSCTCLAAARAMDCAIQDVTDSVCRVAVWACGHPVLGVVHGRGLVRGGG